MPRTVWGHRGQARVAAGRDAPDARSRRHQESAKMRRSSRCRRCVWSAASRASPASRWPARARPRIRSATSAPAVTSSARSLAEDRGYRPRPRAIPITMDLGFPVPTNLTPVLLEFKRNNIVQVSALATPEEAPQAVAFGSPAPQPQAAAAEPGARRRRRAGAPVARSRRPRPPKMTGKNRAKRERAQRRQHAAW